MDTILTASRPNDALQRFGVVGEPRRRMHIFIRHAVHVGVVLATVVLASGCALTHPVEKRIEGYTERVKNDGPEGYRFEEHEPQPVYNLVLPVAFLVDVATFPVQLPFVVCIWRFYDITP